MSWAEKKLNVLWLWPDVLNLHGDRGNLMALSRVCGLYGIEAKITRVNRLRDMFWLDSVDIVMLGPGELAVMPQVVSALSRKYADFENYTETGGVLFATGTTGAALGKETIRVDGSRIPGLGLLDMECRERKAVIGDDLIFRTPDDTAVYGLQIQMMSIELAEGQAPFGQKVYGYGNNGGPGEGAVKGGVAFTNALGPVLVKNPWLALSLVRKALARRSPVMPQDALRFDQELFRLELESAKAIQAFNDTKERPK